MTAIEQVAARSWHNELVATAQELAIAALAHGQPESVNPFEPGSMLWIQFRSTYRTAEKRQAKRVKVEPDPQPVGFWRRCFVWLTGEVEA